MSDVAFTAASPGAHRDALVELNIEYVTWVMDGIEQMSGATSAEVLGGSVADYIASTIDKVCGDPPPKGIFYVVEVDGKLAGMGGLRYLRPGVGEIKRLYVRPAFRGMKLGEAALARLLADATRFGYQRVHLDTASFMKSAQRLYESMGFVDCAAYPEVEVPSEFHKDWRFMVRTLSPSTP